MYGSITTELDSFKDSYFPIMMPASPLLLLKKIWIPNVNRESQKPTKQNETNFSLSELVVECLSAHEKILTYITDHAIYGAGKYPDIYGRMGEFTL